MDKYRIKWYAVKTGKSGHGTGLFSYEQAEKIVRTLNQMNRDVLIIHSIERVNEEGS